MSTKRLVISPTAQQDLREAVQWYEAQRSGLGERFAAKIDQLLKRIAVSPFQFPEFDEEVRRALVQQFPYAVYFVLADHAVVILAILHQRRHPDTWKH